MKSLPFYVLCAVIAAGLMFAGQAQAQQKLIGGELLPANAQPGECYARVFVPPTYKTVTQTVLRKEQSSQLRALEPEFDIIDERVLVKEGSERLEIIPAEYAWVEEQVMTQPEHKHLRTIPAVYETVTEQVLERPAHTIWKKGTGPIQRVDYATGEIMCLVKVPASYKTIRKQVLAKPASTSEIITPAQFKTVRKQIMSRPPEVRKIEIPAQYSTVKVKKLRNEASVSSIPIKEEYQTVTKKEQITEGRMEWQAILCETNATPTLIMSLQKALKNAGYNPGSIDGSLGSQTMAAVQAFQKKKGLPQGQLTVETMKSLGLEF